MVLIHCVLDSAVQRRARTKWSVAVMTDGPEIVKALMLNRKFAQPLKKSTATPTWDTVDLLERPTLADLPALRQLIYVLTRRTATRFFRNDAWRAVNQVKLAVDFQLRSWCCNESQETQSLWRSGCGWCADYLDLLEVLGSPNILGVFVNDEASGNDSEEKLPVKHRRG